MIPYFQIITFELGPLTINIWGVFVSLGFLAAVSVAYRRARSLGLDEDALLQLAIWLIIAGFLGARIFYALNEWDQFREDPWSILKIWQGGMAIYGGLICAALAGGVFLRVKKLSFRRYADVIALALPLGIGIGRIGCFFIHDHLGRVTQLPWGINTPEGIRHETAMYEAVFLFALFIGLWLIRNAVWIRSFPGRITLLFFGTYSAFRFFNDFLRATDLPGSDPVVWLGWHPSQFFALFSVVMSAALWYWWRDHGEGEGNI
ncbi:MAG: prolipoprotein diacylglyceryl transferase [bacterium]|nr:prolipoprotein diacylglyceryl transferase [bacterium]